MLKAALGPQRPDNGDAVPRVWSTKASRRATSSTRSLGWTVTGADHALESFQGLGADIGQGNVIGPPLTAQQLDECLSQPDRLRRLCPQPPRLLLTGGWRHSVCAPVTPPNRFRRGCPPGARFRYLIFSPPPRSDDCC